jgi:hypothetical protein
MIPGHQKSERDRADDPVVEPPMRSAPRPSRFMIDAAPVLAVVATIAVGSITVAGQYIASKRTLDAQMIMIGISVLRAPPTDDAAPIRGWAMDIVERYSGTQFNDTQRQAFMKNALPFGGADETGNRPYDVRAVCAQATKSSDGRWTIKGPVNIGGMIFQDTTFGVRSFNVSGQDLATMLDQNCK